MKVRFLPGAPHAGIAQWQSGCFIRSDSGGSSPSAGTMGVSSKGRTADFEAANFGSNPNAPTKVTCGRGGTGRRPGFRHQCHSLTWRFESSRPHYAIVAEWQTHELEVLAGKTVGVQFPPIALSSGGGTGRHTWSSLLPQRTRGREACAFDSHPEDHAHVAQLAEAPASNPGGCGFDSRGEHHVTIDSSEQTHEQARRSWNARPSS